MFEFLRDLGVHLSPESIKNLNNGGVFFQEGNLIGVRKTKRKNKLVSKQKT